MFELVFGTEGQLITEDGNPPEDELPDEKRLDSAEIDHDDPINQGSNEEDEDEEIHYSDDDPEHGFTE